MAIEIMKTDTDRQSGHITVNFRILDGGDTGPLVQEGIAHQSLTSDFRCPDPATEAEVEEALTRWLASRHPVLLAQHRAIKQRSGVVAKMAGRVLDFGESS